jgi:hypothetical protein
MATQRGNYRATISTVYLLILIFLAGCQLIAPRDIAHRPTATNSPSVGYALLTGLLKDEKDVSKLLIVKRERTELKTLIKEISEKSTDAHHQLEAFAKTDRSLNPKNNGLPPAEIDTRTSIAKMKTKELLTESGKDFELQLLLAQNEALTYGAHLATITATAESDPKRSAYLGNLGKELLDLRQKVVAMLSSNYQWQH